MQGIPSAYPLSSSADSLFIGTWRLLTADYRYSDGRHLDYLGQGATGMLFYDAGGHMSVHLMQAGRPPFASGDRLGGTAEEIKAAFEGYHAYFGTYAVHERESVVVHRLEGCTFPNWIGGEQQRRYKFDGNRLTLTTPPIRMREAEAVGTVVWERVA